MATKQLVKYSDGRGLIADGDLVLIRRRAGLIAVAGRSEHVHAGMAAWWGDSLFLLEMWVTGRAVTLSSQVKAMPGRVDVFETNAGHPNPMDVLAADFSRSTAVETMKRFAGTPYGWRHLLRVALHHLPFTRFVFRPDTRDDSNGGRPICSEAVSHAYRAGGFDPVPHLADRHTEPADLARSPFFRYRFTLE